MSGDDYNMSDYMSFETNIDAPVNHVPPYPQPGFMFPQNPLLMAQAAAQAATQAAMLQATAKAAQAAQTLAQNIPPVSLPVLGGGSSGGITSTASGIKEWLESGKYDFPYGGNIDFFHNRICFDKVCKHDPEMTSDLSTEWLRRSIPIAPYKPAPPKPQHILMHVPKPLQRYSLVPYEDVSKGKIVCGSHVRMPGRSPINPSLSPMNNIGGKSALGLVKISAISLDPASIITSPERIKNFL